MSRMKKKQTYHQYDFEDVYGKEWKVSPLPVSRDGQLNIEDCYDSSVLGEESEAERVDRRMKALASCRIMLQRIISGDYVESNIYPVYLNRKDVPRAEKYRTSREAQKRLNQKNRQKKYIRIINTNFRAGDLIVTMTYKDGEYPSLDRARKDIKNYLAAIGRYRRKQGMTPLKYIYVIEYVDGPTNKVRIHHHLIMSAMDRDVAESKWTKGRVESKYADPDDDFGLEGFARYICKLELNGRHLIQHSRNLKKPIVRENVTKLTRRKMRDLVLAGDDMGPMMERIFQGSCRYIDSKTYISDLTGGFYIYSRLKKKEVKTMETKTASDKANAKADSNLKPVKIYIDMEWKGSLKKGNATYSIVLETMFKGRTYTAVHHGEVMNTTQNRAILHISRIALSHLRGRFNLEIHAASGYLAGGFNLCRFQSAAEREYQATKNADLIDKLLKAAAGHAIRVVPEQHHCYTEWMRKEREKGQQGEQNSQEWEKTIDDKR